MKHIILLLSVMSFLFAAPSWVNGTKNIDNKASAIGIAEAYFPSYTQRKVALMRAKAKLFPEVSPPGQENNQTKSTLHENKKVKVKDSYKDKEGNLYLLVIVL